MEEPFAAKGVRGILHRPDRANGHALALTHGAGSNCKAPLLVRLAHAFEEAGYMVLRYDLPFRQQRAKGPPFPANAESCLLYTSPSPRDGLLSRMPSSA